MLATGAGARAVDTSDGMLGSSTLESLPDLSPSLRGTPTQESLPPLGPTLDSLPLPRPRSRRPSLACQPEGEATILFDWDDTLLPTWFIQEVVKPCSPAYASGPLPPDSPFNEQLAEVAQAVRRVLTEAKRIGRVAIVTMSKRPWVEESAAWYLPGVDIPGLLAELEIPVYYAIETARRPFVETAVAEEGVSPTIVMKRRAMIKCLGRLLSKAKSRLNVISIGDSSAEQEAIKDVLWSVQHAPFPNLCKTVRLAEEPSARYLAAQLEVISLWLGHMATHGEDFDFAVNDFDTGCGRRARESAVAS